MEHQNIMDETNINQNNKKVQVIRYVLLEPFLRLNLYIFIFKSPLTC